MQRLKYILLLCVIFIYGCISTPDYITPDHASYDNGIANSGIICITLQVDDNTLNNIGNDGINKISEYVSKYGQGFIVSNNFINKYNALIEDNNKNAEKNIEKIIENLGVYPIIKHKYYYATKECLDVFIMLKDKQRILYKIENK